MLIMEPSIYKTKGLFGYQKVFAGLFWQRGHEKRMGQKENDRPILPLSQKCRYYDIYGHEEEGSFVDRVLLQRTLYSNL